jgi:hypothetical protein
MCTGDLKTEEEGEEAKNLEEGTKPKQDLSKGKWKRTNQEPDKEGSLATKKPQQSHYM